eukprot:6178616-Pleurochrysis_carterae.AAC.4
MRASSFHRSDEMRNQAYNMRSSMLAMNDVNPDKVRASAPLRVNVSIRMDSQYMAYIMIWDVHTSSYFRTARRRSMHSCRGTSLESTLYEELCSRAAAEKAYKKYWSKVEQFDLACAKKVPPAYPLQATHDASQA